MESNPFLAWEKIPAVEAASSTDIRVRFAETDAQGIVHNSVYLVWFELARVEYLERHAGGYPELRGRGVEALVTETHVRYREPAHFDERLTVRTSCRDVRGARFRFVYEVVRDGATIADGETAHACVDAATFRPTRVPAWLAEAIARAERATA
jgi:acyl-CoA thioester hydrolase